MRSFNFILLIVILFFEASNVSSQCTDEACGLVIRGKVTDLEVDRSGKNAISFRVKLDVDFTNEGSRPIILFKPDNDHGYWLGGWSLYRSKSAGPRDVVFGDGYWQSISGAESYRKLARSLDVDDPPADLTRILQPSESWKFSDDFQIYFEAENGSRFPVHKTWREMQDLGSSVFQMRIVYELSPWNVGYFKPNLIRKLKKRWIKHGNVLVESEKDDRFDHFVHSSELMEIDFSKAKESRLD